MTLGSLFDGSGGFPLAGALCGIEPVWASEIEPYPIAVTSKRIPGMKHLGDIHQLDGSKLQPVDVITFGSPCQDLSIAGRQAGIVKGSRSNLFFEAIRIVQEMVDSTDGKYPKFLFWENVSSALSSNKGADFQAVLQAFADIKGLGADTIPRPDKWRNAGGSWEMTTAWPGEYWMPNIGESPKDVVGSSVYAILEEAAPEKYYLSARACQGIINRAARRGKVLPDILLEALNAGIRAGQ